MRRWTIAIAAVAAAGILTSPKRLASRPALVKPETGLTEGRRAVRDVADPRPLLSQSDLSGKSHMPPPVILTNLPDPDALANPYNEWGVQESLIAYGRHLSKDPMTWQPEVIDAWLEANVPTDYKGYLCLDWEGPGAYRQLVQNSPPHPQLAAMIELYVGLLQHIKAARPRCKVGYYKLPVGGNTSTPEPWFEHARRLQPIFDVADVLFPSYYMRSDQTFETWKLIVNTWLPMVFEVAKDQPIFAYTWHRYQGSFQLIPPDVYREMIAHLISIEHDGKKLIGIVAWSADKSQFENSQWITRDGTFGNKGPRWDNVRAAFAAEMAPGEDIDAYLTRLYARVYSLFPKAGNQAVPDSEPPP